MAEIENFPPVVSHRNHVHSCHDIAEEAYRRLPVPMQTESMRKVLQAVVERTVQMTSMDFARGAERGIGQMAQLIQDPEYFKLLKTRRKREADSYKKQAAAQEREREERRIAPTQQQIEYEIGLIEKWIPDLEKSLVQHRERLTYLKAMPNKSRHVKFEEAKRKLDIAKTTIEFGGKSVPLVDKAKPLRDYTTPGGVEVSFSGRGRGEPKDSEP